VPRGVGVRRIPSSVRGADVRDGDADTAAGDVDLTTGVFGGRVAIRPPGDVCRAGDEKGRTDRARRDEAHVVEIEVRESKRRLLRLEVPGARLDPVVALHRGTAGVEKIAPVRTV